jgi:hypothetical protein
MLDAGCRKKEETWLEYAETRPPEGSQGLRDYCELRPRKSKISDGARKCKAFPTEES